MPRYSALLALVLLAFIFMSAEATHFRYASMSWSRSGRTVTFKLIHAYRSGLTTLNAAVDFGDGTTGTPTTETALASNVPTPDTSVDGKYNIYEATYVHTYTSDAVFRAYYSNGDRIKDLQNGSEKKWSWYSYVDLTDPNDLNSPSLPMPAVVSATRPGPQTIVLPVSDGDSTLSSADPTCELITDSANNELTGYPTSFQVTPDCKFTYDVTDFAVGTKFAVKMLITLGKSKVTTDFILLVTDKRPPVCDPVLQEITVGCCSVPGGPVSCDDPSAPFVFRDPDSDTLTYSQIPLNAGTSKYGPIIDTVPISYAVDFTLPNNWSGSSRGYIQLTDSDFNTQYCQYTFRRRLNAQDVIITTNSPKNSCGKYLSCSGGSSTMTLSAKTSGTCGPITYTWKNSAGTVVGNSADLVVNVADTYTVSVFDTFRTVISPSFSVTASTISATLTDTSSTFACGKFQCNGDATGSLSLAVSTDCGTNSVVWSSSDSTTIPANNDFNPKFLKAGTYTATVSSTNGCSIVKDITISQPTVLTATIAVVPKSCNSGVSCNGASDGAISLTVSGGCAPYSYAWTFNGSPAPTLNGVEDPTGLAAGSYSVKITDANGCFITKDATITAPAVLSATIAAIPKSCNSGVSCNGASDGAISLTVSGGCGPYSYAWTFNGSPAPSLDGIEDPTGLAAGSYSVTITDKNGCTLVKDATITAPAVLTATIAVLPKSCNFGVTCVGANDGAISLTVSGGCGPYSYAWTFNGSPAPSLDGVEDPTGLAAGSYSVTITDKNGCTIVKDATITAPTPLTGTLQPTPKNCGRGVSCTGSSDGEIVLTITSGGCAPLSIKWSSVDSTTIPADGTYIGRNLKAGLYKVTVVDANGCSLLLSASLSQDPDGILSATISKPNCGAIDLAVTGGCAPYSYQWTVTDGNGLSVNPGPYFSSSQGSQAGPVNPGLYSVKITDANGCFINRSILLRGTIIDDGLSPLSEWDTVSPVGSWTSTSPSPSSFTATSASTALSIMDSTFDSLENPLAFKVTVPGSVANANKGSIGIAMGFTSTSSPFLLFQWGAGQSSTLCPGRTHNAIPSLLYVPAGVSVCDILGRVNGVRVLAAVTTVTGASYNTPWFTSASADNVHSFTVSYSAKRVRVSFDSQQALSYTTSTTVPGGVLPSGKYGLFSFEVPSATFSDVQRDVQVTGCPTGTTGRVTITKAFTDDITCDKTKITVEVNWGDGETTTYSQGSAITAFNNIQGTGTLSVSHVYEVAGDYNVKITISTVYSTYVASRGFDVAPGVLTRPSDIVPVVVNDVVAFTVTKYMWEMYMASTVNWKVPAYSARQLLTIKLVKRNTDVLVLNLGSADFRLGTFTYSSGLRNLNPGSANYDVVLVYQDTACITSRRVVPICLYNSGQQATTCRNF